MKNRSQSFLKQSSVILLFFCLTSLNGQAEIQNSFVKTLKDDAVFISMNSDQLLFYYENKKDFENCSLIIRSDKDLNIIEVVCKTTTDFISSI